MRLEHIAFNVEDPAGLAAWYCEHLGMRVARSIAETPYIHFLADSAGKSLIEIYNDDDGSLLPYAQHHPTTFHLAFATDDIEAERQRLVAAGAALDGEINNRANGDRLAFLRDPWGHALQLVQRQAKMIE